MLVLEIGEEELWDERNEKFIHREPVKLVLEHSLLAIAKWESKWHKPFLSERTDDKTQEETMDYIRCMSLTEVSIETIARLKSDDISKINAYIEDKMTATWFKQVPGAAPHSNRTGEIITNEVVYYWMVELGIPFSCETWHINRLFTLIRVCNEKQQPKKKMGKKDTISQYAALNAARRQRLGSRG